MADARNFQVEGTSLFVLAFNANTTTHCFGKAPAKIKSEAGATNLAGVAIVNPVELLEQVRDIFSWNADTAIADTHDDVFGIAANINHDVTVRCVFNSVFNQI
ncbi:hypothetical protein D3C87_1657920 [compost metagenome]